MGAGASAKGHADHMEKPIDAAEERMRVIEFPCTFTSDEEKLKENPDKYKPVDRSLKESGFAEEHRCAFFMYIVRNGADEIEWPASTKAAAQKYLEENDDMSIWFLDTYERHETSPPEYFVSIKDLCAEFQQSNMYQMMRPVEKNLFRARRRGL